jgi:TRAP-type mannitol/chloroaromatic compound transport system substrate-binding protein
MDRRSLIRRAGIAGVLATGAAPAVHAQPALRWRLASSFPKQLDIIYGGAEVFAAKVKQLSGGRFDVAVHPVGEVVPASGVLDAVQQHKVEVAHTAAHYFSAKDETFALGSAIPFGLNSRQMTAWYVDGDGQQLMRDFYAKYDIVNFPCGNTGALMGGWFRREIASLEDVRGLKIRIGGLAGTVIERMGGVRVAVPGAELVRALESGDIDAADWLGPYDDLKLGLNRAAPYYFFPAWWRGGMQLDLFVNSRAYSALTDEQKGIVEAASAFAHMDMQAKYDSRNIRSLKILVGTGTLLRPVPVDVMDEAFAQATALYEELNAKNESWKKVYASYSRFRTDQNLWFRFSEMAFDRFMQSQKL